MKSASFALIVVLAVLLCACGNEPTQALIRDDVAETESHDIPVVLDIGGDLPLDLPDLHEVHTKPEIELELEMIEEVDTGPEAEPGEPGYACESGDDCNSGFCIQTPWGKQCTLTCDEECPFGWECVLHMPSLPDQVYICAPAYVDICKPCISNSDCFTNGVDSGQTCVPYGTEGSFCGEDCVDDSECPEAYFCDEVEDASGAVVQQCILSEGICECTEWFVDQIASTQCFVENEWGTCAGDRVCMASGLTDCEAPTPAEEVCNQKDDNCNGEVDEGLVETECILENEFGDCPGIELCISGELLCDGPPPEAESCDGMDNDCNGDTDEGFPDTDEDGIADCMETDKDGDGVPDGADNCPSISNEAQEDFDVDNFGDVCDLDDDNDMASDEEDCGPLDPEVHPGAEEVCDGKDNDCNLIVDEGFVDTDTDGWKNCIDDDDDNDEFVDIIDCAPLDPAIYPGAVESCDGLDNDCDNLVDEDFPDSDEDGIADCIEDDVDGDGIPDGVDNCPDASNPDQLDMDEDGSGDACDADVDGDGIPNNPDNCEMNFNPSQTDSDEDGLGDQCDADLDGDGKENEADNCPGAPNPGQEDLDGDNQGDECDADDDGDGVEDVKDNCPMFWNPDQFDTDSDGAGEVCDEDDDGDGTPDEEDNCPLVPNADQTDCDGDGIGAACESDDDADGVAEAEDNCVCLSNPGQEDLDGDGIGDACDPDMDDDGLKNAIDNCPGVFNPQQSDFDGDGMGDECDDDKDGDGVPDVEDNCPFTPNPLQEDTDNDDIGDACEDDTDGDQIPDSDDNCPGVPNPLQTDTDQDQSGDQCDDDDDGDGDPDDEDCASLDPAIHHDAEEICDGVDNNCNALLDEGFDDFDIDGLKNCVDEDDDGDQDPDMTDCEPLNPDVHTNAEEECNGVDDDCSGEPDDGFGTTSCGSGICEHEIEVCEGGELQFCNPFEGAVDEVCDGDDNNCNGEVDEGYLDTDNDSDADCIDGDDDGDGVADEEDNCPLHSNPGQEDSNNNGVGDACDEDVCGDGEVEDGEQCDDGNKESCDGCSAGCTLEKKAFGPDLTDKLAADAFSAYSTYGASSAAWAFDNLFDYSGSGYKKWHSGTAGTFSQKWLQVDFGQDKKRVERACVAQVPNYSTANYKFQASNNGSQWTDVYYVMGDPANGSMNCWTFDNPQFYRYYRVKGTEGNSNWWLVIEVELFEATFCPICGDDILQSNEECDDGNGDDCDGCSSECEVEPHYHTGDLTDDLPDDAFTAYSTYSASSASWAFDGLYDWGGSGIKKWHSGTAGAFNQKWLMVDFGAGNEKRIERLCVAQVPSYSTGQYYLEGSNGGGQFETVYQVLNDPANNALDCWDFLNTKSYRYYRLRGTTANSNWWLVVEVELMEASYCHECGDGVLEPPEECDDGNVENCDGCNDSCLLETDSDLTDDLPESSFAAYSTHSGSSPSWAFDGQFDWSGNGSKKWHSGTPGSFNQKWLRVDFGTGKARQVEKLCVAQVSQYATNTYVLQGSTDNLLWADVYQVTDDPLNSQVNCWEFVNPEKYRFYRLRGTTGNSNWWLIVEVEMFFLAGCN